MTDGENSRIGSPVDDLDIDSIDDLVDWLECAAEDCTSLVAHVRTSHDREYLRGRAHAFGLAAALAQDLVYRERMLGGVD